MLPPPAYQPDSLSGILLYKNGKTHLEAGFPLRCFQRLSIPYIATLQCHWRGQQLHQRYVHSGPLVLGTALLNFPTPTTDRDRTVSRRSEPSSRATLMGEQPNPWKRLHLQDVTSRHRGANQRRLCELLALSACYPRGNFYPLSDDHSILNRLITKSCFRICLTCRSRS